MKKLHLVISACCIALLPFSSCNRNASENKTQASDSQELAESGISSKHLAVDILESKIYWKGSMPLNSHHGTLGLKEGNLYINGTQLESGNFIIDMNTIFCEDLKDPKMSEKLIGHLQSPDFFDVGKYPEGRFAITKVEDFATDSTTHRINGNLYLKGVEKNISFTAKITKEGEIYKAVAGPFTIDRTQWGVNYKSKNIFKDLQDSFIKDEIEIRLLILAKEAK